MELSWRLRPSSSSLPDKFVDCNANDIPGTGTVSRVRLDWTIDQGTSTDSGSASWPCTDNHGVTGFDLAPGTAALTVHLECVHTTDDKEADPNTYTAPAAQLRDVVAGETISLGAVGIVLLINDCDSQPCICK